MEPENNLDWQDLSLDELLAHGQDQTGNLTFYKLAFNAFDQLARDNAGDDEVYHRSLLALVSGFLAVMKPEFRPQAVAVKNLLLRKAAF